MNIIKGIKLWNKIIRYDWEHDNQFSIFFELLFYPLGAIIAETL